MHTFFKRLLIVLILLVVLYFILLIPDSENVNLKKAGKQPFAWKADSTWNKLEAEFSTAKKLPEETVSAKIDSLFLVIENGCIQLESADLPANDPLFDKMLNNVFYTSAYVAAQPFYIAKLNQLYARIRTGVKAQSIQWNINDTEVRNQLYKTLYGMRAAVEEAVLQDSTQTAATLYGKDEHSATDSINIFGLAVHSGDLLVSRGGAEVSAFISRGNDYPGNFSHIALIYIDEATHIPYLIEAHIEKGVAISAVEDYIKDKKLRFMVMRPRFDLLKQKGDTLLPQKAAQLAYNAAQQRHIPYDFKMDYFDTTAMFCSEVGSYAYAKQGLQLWQPVSTISSEGVSNWLHNFGVENFVTQMPADLEYDPQLTVAGEWRGIETLYQDHIDNAVMDALISQAETGKQIKYNIWMLPVARCIKGWCMLQNMVGKPGKIPEGMNATQALKNQQFEAIFQKVKAATLKDAENFMVEKKYRAPYWQLVKMAEENAKD